MNLIIYTVIRGDCEHAYQGNSSTNHVVYLSKFILPLEKKKFIITFLIVVGKTTSQNSDRHKCRSDS